MVSELPEDICLQVVGNANVCSESLRPIVSIDLESSGYNLVEKNGNDGIQYKLTKQVE